MLNRVWFWLLVIGIVYGFAKGAYQSLMPPAVDEPAASAPSEGSPPTAPTKLSPLSVAGQRLTNAALDSAKAAVELCIGLIGLMALWLGLMQVASDAGLIDALARALRPVMRWLFPELPDGHPAQGAVLMNLSANMLGLDNAATPMGLKAMQELQKLNPRPDTATNSMAMFLAINTSSITLIPFTIIGYRAAAGSANPAAPIAGTFIATVASTIVAITVCRWMSGWSMFQAPPSSLGEANSAEVAT